MRKNVRSPVPTTTSKRIKKGPLGHLGGLVIPFGVPRVIEANVILLWEEGRRRGEKWK